MAIESIDTNYKVRVRSMQYSFFGKNQKNEEIEEKIDKEIKEIVGKKKTIVKEALYPMMFPFDRLDKSVHPTI